MRTAKDAALLLHSRLDNLSNRQLIQEARNAHDSLFQIDEAQSEEFAVRCGLTETFGSVEEEAAVIHAGIENLVEDALA